MSNQSAFEEMLVAAAQQQDAPVAEGAEGYVNPDKNVVPKGEDNDAEKDMTPEKKARLQRRFEKRIAEEKRQPISEHTRTYRSRKGKEHEMEVHEQEVPLYVLTAEPDELQYSAQATQTRQAFAD